MVDNGVTIAAKDVSNLYKIVFRFNGNINAASYVSSESDLISKTNEIIPIPVLIVLFISGIILCITQYIEKLQIRSELASRPHLLTNLYKKWVPKYFTPAEFACVLTDNRFISYLVGLAGLINQDIVKTKSSFKYIVYPINYDDNEIIEVLEECREYALKQKLPTESENEYWLLPIQYLEMYFKTRDGYKAADYATYQKISKFKNIRDKELLKDIKKMRKVASVMQIDGKLPVVEFSEVVKKYNKNTKHVPCYCFQQKDPSKDSKRNASFYLTAIALSGYHVKNNTVKPKFDLELEIDVDAESNGSSCSSCSGCGGCGGSD
jgi:hypothetical protein